MSALAASDVTVAITERWYADKHWHSRGTLTFGDGLLTYPTAGIPLPAIDQFGMRDELQELHIFGVNERTLDYQVRFGPANRTLLLYNSSGDGDVFDEADTSEAPAARTYSFHAVGR